MADPEVRRGKGGNIFFMPGRRHDARWYGMSHRNQRRSLNVEGSKVVAVPAVRQTVLGGSVWAMPGRAGVRKG
jgi:hypothetical protein